MAASGVSYIVSFFYRRLPKDMVKFEQLLGEEEFFTNHGEHNIRFTSADGATVCPHETDKCGRKE